MPRYLLLGEEQRHGNTPPPFWSISADVVNCSGAAFRKQIFGVPIQQKISRRTNHLPLTWSPQQSQAGESIATTPSFCGELSLSKSCAGRANNTWRSWARAEREQGRWAEAVCAPGWGWMPPPAPGDARGEWARLDGQGQLPWAQGQLCHAQLPSEPAWSKVLEWNCPSSSWLGWGHTTGQMEGLALGNHLWAEAWLHHTHTSAPAEFSKEKCPCPSVGSRRMAHCPLWLGTNTQSPNNLVLAGASFFLYLIFFVVVVFSLLKTNFRFVSWK